jgi:hypothetical protein
MSKKNGGYGSIEEMEALIREITDGCHDESDCFSAFCQAVVDETSLPASGFVVGAPVSVFEIYHDAATRAGLRAKCRRRDGSEYAVSLCDVVFPEDSPGSLQIAAYRMWLGLDPLPEMAQLTMPTRRLKRRVADDDIDLTMPVELVVLMVKQRAARCRLLGKDRILTLRAADAWKTVPGEIIAVRPAKYWLYSNNPYLSGEITSARIDAAALGLVPLKLDSWGMWDPKDEYWGEEGIPVEGWAKPIIARGVRPIFEMEQVIPGADPQSDTDPILDAVDLRNAGNYPEAVKLLMGLCEADLRCIDAHAHLGHFTLDAEPQMAIRHYEVGMRIGELSLPSGFDGLLPWPNIDNRPFLRCMHGYGLSLWRLKRFREAAKIFERMLWLNPSDNQGIRFLIDDVKDEKSWRKDAYHG